MWYNLSLSWWNFFYSGYPYDFRLFSWNVLPEFKLAQVVVLSLLQPQLEGFHFLLSNLVRGSFLNVVQDWSSFAYFTRPSSSIPGKNYRSSSLLNPKLREARNWASTFAFQAAFSPIWLISRLPSGRGDSRTESTRDNASSSSFQHRLFCWCLRPFWKTRKWCF